MEIGEFTIVSIATEADCATTDDLLKSSLPRITAQDEDEPETETLPLDGCLALGVDDRKYFTRYWIDFKAQNSRINKKVVNEEYFPCCRDSEEGRSIFWNTLGVFRNELSLYSLHLVVILLGVVKESMVVKGLENSNEARLVYTCVETTSAAILVFMRTLNAWVACSSAANDIDQIGFVHKFGRIGASLSLLRYFRLYLIAAGSLLTICTITFIVCLSLDLLEWTLLSNIVCIITLNLLSSLYTARVTRTLSWVREDAIKVMALEGVALLKSSPPPPGQADDTPRTIKTTAEKSFVDAVELTKIFRKPEYIYEACRSQSQVLPENNNQ